MNTILTSLFSRKSVRAYTDREITEEQKNLIFESALQAPTAGNQTLYTMLEISDPGIKKSLSVLCDNQPFINDAKLVVVFLADCQRWTDCYAYAGVSCRKPGYGDMLLACEDAMIAAQNTVTAAESLGIGSCYIGDILEHKEKISELLELSPLTFPVTMVVFGYPTEQQKNRTKPKRAGRRFIVQENTYRRLSEQELRLMYGEQQTGQSDFNAWMKAFCERKYMSDFSKEMTRSVGAYFKNFAPEPDGQP